MITKSFNLFLCCIALAFFWSCFFFSHYDRAIQKVDISQTDALNYQLLAVNLALHGVYPKLNLISDLNDYKIETCGEMRLSSSLAASFYFKDPPVDDFTKPPVYPLLMAFIYWLWGVHPSYIIVFQMALICTVAALQPLAGFRLLGWKGFLVGILTAYSYFQTTVENIHHFYPHFLVQFFLMLIFLISCKKREIRTWKTHFIVGILLGLTVLTNGNTIFIPFFYFLFHLFCAFRNKPFRPFLASISGFILLLLPWICFANYTLLTTKPERLAWTKKLWEGVQIQKVTGPVFLSKNKPTRIDSIVMTNCIRNLYSKFCSDGYVIISKQPFGDEILGTHNEFTHDGEFHPEWRFLLNSYYNLHPSSRGSLARIVQFYIDNPNQIIHNVVGKFKGTAYGFSTYYYLSALLFGLFPITFLVNKNKYLSTLAIVAILFLYVLLPQQYVIIIFLASIVVSIAFLFSGSYSLKLPIVWLITITNTALMTILFVGEARYVQIVDPFLQIGFFFLIYQYLKALNLFPQQDFWYKLTLFYQSYIKPFRFTEVLLMSGYFLVAFLFSMNDLRSSITGKNFALYLSILFYISSVYMLNSYSDYKADKLNPRLIYVGQIPKKTYLYLMIACLMVAVAMSVFISVSISILFVASFTLWVLYYTKPFRLKSSLLGGTAIHFVSGVIHFQIGYQIAQPLCYLSFMISCFFATLLSMGHLNHELIDLEADKNSGIKNSAVRLGTNIVQTIFYFLFFISQAYWLLALKWHFINQYQFFAFFYLPFLTLLLLTRNGHLLVNPIQVQKIFRWLMGLSATIILCCKLFRLM